MDWSGLNRTADCYNTSTSHLRAYNYASSISSMITFFPTLCLLVVIFFYHTYGSILHRLFIYFTLSILAFLFAYSTDLQLQYNLSERFCRWTGYTKVATHMIALLFSSEICAYLLCKMYYQVCHHKKLPQLSKARAVILEIGIVVLTVLPPPLLLLLAKDKFGLFSTECWLQLFKSNSCDPFLDHQRDPLVLNLILIKGVFYSFNFVSYSILIGLFCWLACNSEVAKKQYFRTARRTVILVVLLVCTSGTDLVALVLATYTINKKTARYRVLVILFAIYYAAVQFAQPIAYLVYLNSVKKFQWDSTKDMARRWKHRGLNCCAKALRWLVNPFSTTSESEDLLKSTNNNLNLNDTPALTSSMSLYGSHNQIRT